MQPGYLFSSIPHRILIDAIFYTARQKDVEISNGIGNAVGEGVNPCKPVSSITKLDKVEEAGA